MPILRPSELRTARLDYLVDTLTKQLIGNGRGTFNDTLQSNGCWPIEIGREAQDLFNAEGWWTELTEHESGRWFLQVAERAPRVEPPPDIVNVYDPNSVDLARGRDLDRIGAEFGVFRGREYEHLGNEMGAAEAGVVEADDSLRARIQDAMLGARTQPAACALFRATRTRCARTAGIAPIPTRAGDAVTPRMRRAT